MRKIKRYFEAIKYINSPYTAREWLGGIAIMIFSAITEYRLGHILSHAGTIAAVVLILVAFYVGKSRFKTKKAAKKANAQKDTFIPFKAALDYVIDFRDRTQKYIDILCSSENSYAHDFYSLNYSCFKEGGLTMVGTDMYSLLNLIKEKKLSLYGQKTLTKNNLRVIDLSSLEESLYWTKENWSEDLSTLYDPNSKNILYINLRIKRADIESLINSVQ